MVMVPVCRLRLTVVLLVMLSATVSAAAQSWQEYISITAVVKP